MKILFDAVPAAIATRTFVRATYAPFSPRVSDDLVVFAVRVSRGLLEFRLYAPVMRIRERYSCGQPPLRGKVFKSVNAHYEVWHE